MGIYDEVLAWSSEKLPPWRQDVLRRLVTTGEITSADIDEIYELAKLHHRINTAADPVPRPIPFDASHFPAEPQAEKRVTLSSLRSLTNIGKIPADQVLTFQADGLTIVYGGNGVGKSGYARILKQACRARSPGVVYANAFDPN